MEVEPGQRLGPYEIVAPLGRGGMGEVWRARDTRLGREVALKFLPADFAADPERHARFEREAKVLAALNHPHIAMLFGLEHLDGQHALAMELVEGEGLEERIARGPVPTEEALAIALQIADALEAAHEKGIAHRDLKPANVKVRGDGTVKVLDFGLAKAWEEQTSSSDLAFSPTITGHHTRAGVILGTAAYMSPEQARGKAVDKRTDIWAFGCVLYEMLSGSKPFDGETLTDLMAAIVKQEPDWAGLPPSVPPHVRAVVRRCLEKDPKRRFRDIGDVRFELQEAAQGAASVAAESPAAPARSAPAPRSAWFPWIVAGLGVALGAGVAVVWLRPPAPRAPTIRALIVAPEKTSFAFGGAVGAAVISPDGTRLVFSALEASGKRLLWVRPLDSLTAQPLEGTDGGTYPFWSPDSRHIAYFSQGRLRRIDANGGPSQVICEASNGRGGSWSRDGAIVFAPSVYGPLQRVPSGGGTPVAVTAVDKADVQTSHRWPVFLPDGRHFVFWAGIPGSRVEKDRSIFLGSVDGAQPRYLLQAESDALYAPPGYLLYLRDRSLMAQRFDAARLKVAGDAIPIVEAVENPEQYRLGQFSVASDGTLVYVAARRELTQAIWFGEAGAREAPATAPADIGGAIRLSPDGKTLAVPIADPNAKSIDIWLIDLARGVKTRFTFDRGVTNYPVWSPDGGRLAWSSDSKGHPDIYVKSATGAGEPELLLASDADKFVNDWSRDGRFLTFTRFDAAGKTGADLWILPLSGDRKPFPFLATPFNEGNGMFSPDGRWLAYESEDSGRNEIYISPFPQGGGRWQVSQGGGTTPSWRADGHAVYYATPEGRLMEAPVAGGANAPDVGTPHEFSNVEVIGFGSEDWTYAVAPKGDRVLVLRPETTTPVPLTLVTNWAARLQR